MTVLIIVCAGLAVIGVGMVVVGQRMREAAIVVETILAQTELERAERQLEEQIDELILDLWVRRAEVEGWIPARPHDQ